MEQKELYRRLEKTMGQRACQCVGEQHASEPCPNEGGRFATDDYFSYTCKQCRDGGHHPFLVYGRESGGQIGQVQEIGGQAEYF